MTTRCPKAVRLPCVDLLRSFAVGDSVRSTTPSTDSRNEVGTLQLTKDGCDPEEQVADSWEMPEMWNDYVAPGDSYRDSTPFYTSNPTTRFFAPRLSYARLR
jgi:hypothetical protein